MQHDWALRPDMASKQGMQWQMTIVSGTVPNKLQLYCLHDKSRVLGLQTKICLQSRCAYQQLAGLHEVLFTPMCSVKKHAAAGSRCPMSHNSACGDVVVVDSSLLFEWHACFTNMQAYLMHWMLNDNLSCICMGAGLVLLLC